MLNNVFTYVHMSTIHTNHSNQYKLLCFVVGIFCTHRWTAWLVGDASRRVEMVGGMVLPGIPPYNRLGETSIQRLAGFSRFWERKQPRLYASVKVPAQ